MLVSEWIAKSLDARVRCGYTANVAKLLLYSEFLALLRYGFGATALLLFITVTFRQIGTENSTNRLSSAS